MRTRRVSIASVEVIPERDDALLMEEKRGGNACSVCLQPIGALLLEQCRVEREDAQVFSIVFLDEAERRYQFECDSQDQCVEWVEAIVKASYEFMRRNLIYYRTEIHRLTGKVRSFSLKLCWSLGFQVMTRVLLQDPLEQFGISEETRFQVQAAHR
ncbi:hypothetical protein DNTS_001752 [Danionella cerebrum]|uniref:PH domain-containing protein n=1 Tax=Danionella cerebrum TaxID=2873325 RepID=A0A553MRV8_9TELE|nr:hypothetical protein DNTS_001752 [Danionella translucida]